MAKILVTGGCGYIGSHTIALLAAQGYDIISTDNNARSNPVMLKGVELITRQKIKNYKVDLCNFDDTVAIFHENPDITGIIHLAAYKSAAESVENPLLYFENNLSALINILKCAQEFGVSHFIYASSGIVYGNTDVLPVTEKTLPRPATSPYGYTKQMGEQMIIEFAQKSGTSCVILRYFNPAGAHPSGIIGEMPPVNPENLVSVITQAAAGRLPSMTVNGTDYPTPDGSCIRDFIHVCDIAEAHLLALRYLEAEKNISHCEVYNLGSSKPVSVLEVIQTFEKISGLSVPFKKGTRRPGDIMSMYTDNQLAREKLGWKPRYTLAEILETAWRWEMRLKADATVFSSQSGELN
ncbi:MAG: UDP-glucose 4-epimerase GalE [Bacteroidetes bacterium]|nr:UDP-glucose 4-epimerase GalE [Bacteroidota bacterium]